MELNIDVCGPELFFGLWYNNCELNRFMFINGDWRGLYILVRRRVFSRTPKTEAPEAYLISLRIPFHFFSISLYLKRLRDSRHGFSQGSYLPHLHLSLSNYISTTK